MVSSRTQTYPTSEVGSSVTYLAEPKMNVWWSISSYLANLIQEIAELVAVAKAQTLAKETSDADGEIADDEVKSLDLVIEAATKVFSSSCWPISSAAPDKQNKAQTRLLIS